MFALFLPRVVGFARAIPIWAWALVAVLAWGGWQRHKALATAAEYHAAIVQAAGEQQAALQASITETQRRLTAQQEITHAADQAASAARSDADRAGAAARRLRDQLAADQAHRRAADPAAAGPSEADRLTDVLGQCVERYASVAAAADRAVIAGQTCERSYESLIAPR